MNLPLCFVLMPFGKKSNIAGWTINFDAVYKELIDPAIKQAGLEPLRADEEMTGGIIQKPMFERLILCEYDPNSNLKLGTNNGGRSIFLIRPPIFPVG